MTSGRKFLNAEKSGSVIKLMKPCWHFTAELLSCTFALSGTIGARKFFPPIIMPRAELAAPPPAHSFGMRGGGDVVARGVRSQNGDTPSPETSVS